MNQLTIGDITVDVVRKDIKNMHLAVYPPTGRVRIAAPLRINDDAIRLFAISKLAWIKRHQRNFEDQERITPREYKERESHYFQGERYLLRIKETNGPGRVDLTSKTYLDVYVKPSADATYIKKVIDKWYRSELKKVLPEMVNRWEQKIGVTIDFLGIKQMKTKWGSCNIDKKRIWLNLELAKKPFQCLEYILVHEMVHLLERHHNERFRAYMDQYLPNWKQFKDELNRLPVSHADWDY
ncbi:M48 family metallopeptidase [Flavilitoribacter nigricans]|uniref:Metal-dependent hydrolase n=1 Tax=Flavilitoribacter nigricans (strain ATCC 23147 / DSM 23189 / NBRC 102662 / NCIMB 1420 / SS-2) TaxID=1122177 RepID=A0A2D0N780_FLAN2|nr:SprT family zinc-dependent metalloprotease [Flavilitoribacter nigricans]PHN04371.1 metal-dependent hydrolase [Flavilitoribacter nigricans DSM 23189 = NBRC 102662]